MICPICGAQSLQRTCSGCGRSLEALYSIKKETAKWYNAGLTEARNGRLEHAKKCLEKALRYDAENVDALNLLGLLYDKVGELGEAAACWKRSVKVMPGEQNPAAEYLKKAAKSGGKAEDCREAIRHYNQALELYAKNQTDAGYPQIRKAVELNDQFVKAREFLAVIEMKEKRLDKAEALLNSVRKINREDPELPSLYYLLQQAQQEEAQNGGLPSDVKNVKMPKESRENLLSDDAAEKSDDTPLLLRRKPWNLKALFRRNSTAIQGALFFIGFAVGILFMFLFG